MKKRAMIVSVLLLVAFAASLGVGALAEDSADVRFTFVEDSGSYVGRVLLMTEDQAADKYELDLKVNYGWLWTGENGEYRYELDLENETVVAARESGQTLTDTVTLRWSSSNGAVRTIYPSFRILPKGTTGGYELANNGEAAVAEGSFFSEDTVKSEKPTVLGISCAGGEYKPCGSAELVYTFNNWRFEVQSLSAGERTAQTLEFRLRKPDGSAEKQTVEIITVGTDDIPTVQSFSHELGLGGDKSVSGSALAGSTMGDGWDGQHIFKWTTEASAAKYGTMTLGADGTYSYTLNVNNADVRALTEGSTPLSDVFAYVYSDKDGSTAYGSVSAVIAFDDIAPAVTSPSGTLTEDSGTADTDACYTFAGNALYASALGNGTAAQHRFAWTSAATSEYGTVTLGADGSFSFRLGNALDKVQQLGPNETVTQAFNFTYSDADGDPAYGELSVTIVGADDIPTLQAAYHGVTEDAGSYTTSGSALMGSFLGDGTAAQHVFAWADGVKTASPTQYGTVTLGADGSYSYTLDNDGRAVQALKDGESVTEVFDYTYTDPDGSVGNGSLTINVVGVNDVPTVVNATCEIYLDDSSAHTGNALSGATMGDGLTNTFTWTTLPTAASYGTATLNGDGTYSYTLNISNADVRGLSSGSKLTDSFGYSYSDGEETATGTLNIDIKYKDIHPVASVVHELTEGEPGEAAGNVFSGCTLGNGTQTQHTITWGTPPSGCTADDLDADGSYSISGIDMGVYDHLKEGATADIVFPLTIKDADDAVAVAGSLTIRIVGVNNAPTISSALTVNPYNISLSGNGRDWDLTGLVTDVDDDATLTYSIEGSTHFGTATISGNTISYTVDKSLATVGSIELISFKVTDGFADASGVIQVEFTA